MKTRPFTFDFILIPPVLYLQQIFEGFSSCKKISNALFHTCVPWRYIWKSKLPSRLSSRNTPVHVSKCILICSLKTNMEFYWYYLSYKSSLCQFVWTMFFVPMTSWVRTAQWMHKSSKCIKAVNNRLNFGVKKSTMYLLMCLILFTLKEYIINGYFLDIYGKKNRSIIKSPAI